MLAGIAAPAPSHLPPRYRARTSLPRSARLVPHPLACHRAEGKGGGERDAAHTIFPAHAVVLAAHCAKLLRLPPSVPSGSSRTATLPVLPLWQDMVALGVYDSELWDALDLAWELVLGTLDSAAQ
ncbi:hypothetical protein DFH09DRAFT_1314838 [Mycena vulgaris]|nr:hypothetical protein DFH09DRAFT_1314838 [Mycena vulgaris]